MRRFAPIVGACLIGASPPAASQTVELETQRMRLTFSLEGARPIAWSACYPACSSHREPVREVIFTEPGDPPVLAVRTLDDSIPRGAIDRLRYRLERETEADLELLRFTSEPLDDGTVIEKRYRVWKDRYRVELTVDLVESAGAPAPRRLGLALTAGEAFQPPPAAGFAGAGEDVRAVSVDAGEVWELDGESPTVALPLGAGSWIGLRNRFWALLARPLSDVEGEVERVGLPGEIRPRVLLSDSAGVDSGLGVALFAGPVDRGVLLAEDPELARLQFSGLWWWMRAISLGLLLTLDAIQSVIGHHGVAILVLAVVVKIAMTPLTRAAERWQADVNRTQSLLEPHLQAIKAEHKGEEQTRRIVALYDSHGVHPLYSMKSLLGFLIQIPVFVAAYYMLNENFGLNGASLAWIADLSRPDHLWKLPVDIPFFGHYLNLLPFLMTGITVLASAQFASASLTPQLQRRQRRQLYAMAALFFVLFYTFPAGMVWYWTCTNLVQYIKDQVVRSRLDVAR